MTSAMPTIPKYHDMILPQTASGTVCVEVNYLITGSYREYCNLHPYRYCIVFINSTHLFKYWTR